MGVIAVRVVLFVPLLVLIAQAAAAQTANNPRLVAQQPLSSYKVKSYRWPL